MSAFIVVKVHSSCFYSLQSCITLELLELVLYRLTEICESVVSMNRLIFIYVFQFVNINDMRVHG